MAGGALDRAGNPSGTRAPVGPSTLECAALSPEPVLDAAEPSRELSTLREKTERLLSQAVREFECVGDRYEVPYHATCVVVHPMDWTDGRTLLRFIAPVVVDVEPASGLHERLGELNNTTIFGKYYVRDRTVFLEHNLLGESVEKRGFRAALASVAHHADHVDDALLAEFGGRRWSEHA
jgi:hypothetical protein